MAEESGAELRLLWRTWFMRCVVEVWDASFWLREVTAGFRDWREAKWKSQLCIFRSAIAMGGAKAQSRFLDTGFAS